MNEDQLDVYFTYWDLHATNLIYDALSGKRQFISILVLGEPGLGKTSYVYYSLKTAIAKYLCYRHGAPDPDSCLNLLSSKINVCWGRSCEQDDLDKKYEFVYYTGLSDIPRFINDVYAILGGNGDAQRRLRVMLLDDLVSKSLYNYGGELRRLYLAFKDLVRIMRTVSRVVLSTGTAPEYFPVEFLRISKVIIARRGFGSTLFERKHTEYFTKLWFGREYQFRALVHEFTDEVPWQKEFGLPTWLEQRIEERKRVTAKAIIEWAMKDSGRGNTVTGTK
jgi:hypothetical protein